MTSKVSISLPADVLARAERARRVSGESRSELFRRALETLFESERHDAAVASYVEGYVAEPESEYEVAVTAALAGTAFDDEEDWE